VNGVRGLIRCVADDNEDDGEDDNDDGDDDGSFLIWSVRSLIPQDRVRFVRNHLRRGARFSQLAAGAGRDDGGTPVDTMPTLHDVPAAAAADVDVRRFTDFYLRHDGVFLLRLIAHNTNGNS